MLGRFAPCALDLGCRVGACGVKGRCVAAFRTFVTVALLALAGVATATPVRIFAVGHKQRVADVVSKLAECAVAHVVEEPDARS